MMQSVYDYFLTRSPANANPAKDAKNQQEISTISAISVSTITDTETWQERAAIMHCDGGLTQPLAEAYAYLCVMPRPEGIEPAAWQQVIDMAGINLDREGM
jgi:hypothetical protein